MLILFAVMKLLGRVSLRIGLMAATPGGGRGIPVMSPSQPILNLGRWALPVTAGVWPAS